MKIKLTESQLINIVKEAESEKFKKFTTLRIKIEKVEDKNTS